MNYLLTALCRFLLLTALFTGFGFSDKAFAQTCNNWLNTPSQPSWVNIGDLDVPGNQLTVEALINIKGIPPGGVIAGLDVVSKHTGPNNVNYLLRSAHAELSTTNGYFYTPDACDLEMNKTYHVAMVYNGVSLKYYRNGYLLGETPATGNMIQSNLPTGIGFISTLLQAENFIGFINEVRVWNVSRSQAQIRANMSISLVNPPAQTGLLAYYTFDNLLNKQGNPAWNGTLVGAAAINRTNPECVFVADTCASLTNVEAGFIIPDTVCVNTPVNISNISLNATSQYWSFCAADANKIPTAVNLGNPGGSLSLPVFSDVLNDNGNYHVFVSNNWPGGLVRMDFGNSLLNAPVVVNLGNIGGVIPNTIEGIQVVKNEGRWYAIMVGGDFINGGIPSRVIKIDFGVNITNAAPVGTNWGNIGNLAYPVDLHLFQENEGWYGFTVNAQNNTITRFNFSTSFTNVPTGVNLGNLGGLNYPTGINAVKDNGNWYVFITNDVVNSFLVRLDFGNSLLNAPTAVNLGNPGNVLHKTRDIYIMKACDQITGLAVNGDGYNDLVKLNFNNNITATPTGVSLGNTGNMNFPHSLSRLFRAGNDLYSFVTNVNNNTLTRIRFEGCTNSSIPNSALQTPPPITYSTPGVYNINLTVDEGLPTQTSFCKQVVVKDCTIPIIPDFDISDTVCLNTPVTITNNTVGATSHYWNFCIGDINKTPTGTNIGNVGGLLSQPVFMDYAFYNGNYYGFSINHYPGKLVRLNFGNSLLNAPTATDLGNFGGIIPPGYGAEGIQIVQNEGKWYAIIVGGYTPSGSTPRILKIDFGANLANAAPVPTNWGNIGTMSQPLDLHVFRENNNWYGLTINAENNTITRFNFTNSFDNVPTAVNLGGFGMLDYPTGIYAINDNGFWRVFVTNNGSNSRLIRLDFGSSLLNAPTAVNLGGIGGSNGLRDLTILKYCDQVTGFAVNGTTNSLYRLNFATLTSVPTVTNLGNIGNLSTPHSISKIFRVNDNLYSFITNVGNNTITRLQFEGCTNSNPGNSALQNPPTVIYNAPGIYNINLTIDDGLPTQSSVCKQVVVKNCDIVVDPPDTTGCGGFQLALGGQTYDRASDVAATTNNEFYVAGISRSFSSSDDILVTRLTAAGVIVWSRIFGNTRQEIIRKITPTADGGLLIVGQTKSFANINGDMLCMKVGANGNLLWSKVLGLGSANGDLGMDIIETTDGGYAFSGIINVNGAVADAVVTKLDNLANVVWSKRFDRGDGENGVGILQKQDTLIVGIDLQNTIVNYELVLMKLRLTDGAFIMSKKITPDARGLFNSYVLRDPVQPGYIISTHTIENSSYADMKHTVIRVDEEFNVRKSQLFYFNPVTNDFYTGLAVLPNGSVIGTASSQTNADGYIYRINEDNTGVFIKRFNAPTDRRLYRVAVSGQQLMAVGGAISNGQEDFFVTSFDINGVLGAACNVEDLSLILQQPGYSVSSFTWPNINDVNFPVTAAVLNTLTPPLLLKELCPTQKPDFTFKQDPCAPKTIQFFTNLSNIENYEWDFGDGQQNTGDPNPVNSYADFGNYVVKLRIRLTGGCLDSIQKLITVDLAPANIILTNDTTICNGSTKQLLTAPSLSFCWTPTTYLDNPDSPNPITSTPEDITYYFTAEVTGANLITNGNFSGGNVGFTSQYNFTGTNTTEGQYFVGVNPQTWNNSLSPCRDHTSGNGNMMLLNGRPAADVGVWTQTVNVVPNTNYAFSTWIQALYAPNPAQLQFSINGKTAGVMITASLPTCTWNQFYTTWNSGSNTTAVISIINKNTAIQGNDFALDDISFAAVFLRRDSVIIKVEKPLVAATADTTICTETSAQLNATGAKNYIWSPVPGLSAPLISNPVASPIVSTEYIVTGTTINGCSAKDTVNVNIFTKATIVVSDDTLVCSNSQAQLTATGGASYSWTPAASLNNALISNPIASPLSNTMYYVDVTDANTCEYRDSVQVTIRPDAIFAVVDPSPVCRFDSAQITASGGDIYTWQLADGLSSTNVSNPKAAPAVTTDYTVTITESTCNQSATLVTRVTVMPLPVVNAVKSNDIDCRNDRSQLTAIGADQYVWTPASSLNNATIPNPLATPASATQYIVTGVDINGCLAKDTVDVNVFSKPAIGITNDTTICKGAQAQLNVTGGAIYSWSPASTLNNPLISNPMASPVSNTKYYVVIRDAINCEYLDSVEVSVRPDVIFSVNVPGQVCKDGSLQLSAAGGNIYSWLPAAGLNNAGIANPVASPSTTTDYTVTITESTCNQIQSLTTRLTIIPSPAINTTKSNDIDCSNDRSQLVASGASQYSWTPSQTLNNPSVSNPVATPLTTTEYIVEGIDALGCKGYDTITVKVDNINKGSYLMTSAFTPNNDGLNDCYGIKHWGVVAELEFSVYNRWGERIFFTKNAGQCWDGTYKGTKQNGGVYVYMVKAKTTCESEVFRKGTFVLVR